MFKWKDYEAMSLLRKAHEDVEGWRDANKDESSEAKSKVQNNPVSNSKLGNPQE